MSSVLKPLVSACNPPEQFRLLVVSKEAAVVRSLASLGDNDGLLVEIASSGWDAMERLESGDAPQLLLLDLPRGNGDSFHMLRWLRRLNPELPVVALCDAEDTLVRQEAVRLGAEQILSRPLDAQQVQHLLRGYGLDCGIGAAALASELGGRLGPDAFFVAGCPAMQKLRAQAELLAQSDVPIFLVGEPGSGKGAVARLIHVLSSRSRYRFLKLSCAALPESVLEARLFSSGRVFGARAAEPVARISSLSDRQSDDRHLDDPRTAETGTIFLQEIAAMPTNLQARLLETLQTIEAAKNAHSAGTVRIVSATSEDLEHALADNRLRPDLYRRLSAFTLQVPALRQRKEEIPILLRDAMSKMAIRYGLAEREFSPTMLEACQQYAWPGNLTELENFVRRYLVGAHEESHSMGTGWMSATAGPWAGADNGNGNGHEVDAGENEGDRVLGKADVLRGPEFASALTAGNGGTPDAGQPAPQSLKSLIQDVKCEAERKAIGAALERTGWNRKAAARLLRVSYRTLLYKIEQYQMKAAEPFFYATPLKQLKVEDDPGRENGKAS